MGPGRSLVSAGNPFDFQTVGFPLAYHWGETMGPCEETIIGASPQ